MTAHSNPATEMVRVTEATLGDARDIWLWRNDPLSLSMSRQSSVVAWESHLAWYEATLKDKSRKLYIGWLGDSKIGMCRFDIQPAQHCAEISINLNPAFRGHKLSERLLLAAMRGFETSEISTLTAEAKTHNAASLKCFRKCGFSEVQADQEYTTLVLELGQR